MAADTSGPSCTPCGRWRWAYAWEAVHGEIGRHNQTMDERSDALTALARDTSVSANASFPRPRSLAEQVPMTRYDAASLLSKLCVCVSM